MKAVVLGGTGAIGKELVGQLVTSGNWSVVTTVGTISKRLTSCGYHSPRPGARIQPCMTCNACAPFTGRRAVELGEPYRSQEAKAKVECCVVDMDNMAAEARDAFAGADAVFCALGTTRKVGLAGMHASVHVRLCAATPCWCTRGTRNGPSKHPQLGSACFAPASPCPPCKPASSSCTSHHCTSTRAQASTCAPVAD